MEKQTFRETLLEMFGGSETQRGIKLGMLAAFLALFILFGSGALLNKTSDTVNLSTGQIAPLIIAFGAGMLALFVGILLAFYSGLSAPEARSGDAGKAGLLSGVITMVLFWAGQTIYGLVSAAQSSTGVLLNSFLQTTILHGIAYFVFGGLFGWWGARSAARRARSILSPSSSQVLSSSPATTLSILSAGASTSSIPAQDTTPKVASEQAQHEAPPPTLEGQPVFGAETTDAQEGMQS
jgi:hypothetical protein